ncbi:MAG: DUF2294 domain-containing protein [Bacillaceae bacterium]|nr:DUF2294 domain-containing protein [Bacillaceae bacterium]
MEDVIENLQKDISGFTGKLFRDIFGRGPQSVYTSIGYTFISIYLRNFITPSEQVLLHQDQVMTIQQMRDKLMEAIIPQLNTYIELTTGKQVREYYYDWNLHNKSAMITCISSEPFTPKDVLNEKYPEREKIHKEIIDISKKAEKSPEEIYSCQISDRTILIIRNGILVRIEKELIRLGNSELLKRVKRNLEKRFLHNNSRMDWILNQQIVDTFVDWDFNLDKSVIVLKLNPAKPQKPNYEKVDME